jgi:hypothetical protein
MKTIGAAEQSKKVAPFHQQMPCTKPTVGILRPFLGSDKQTSCPDFRQRGWPSFGRSGRARLSTIRGRIGSEKPLSRHGTRFQVRDNLNSKAHKDSDRSAGRDNALRRLHNMLVDALSCELPQRCRVEAGALHGPQPCRGRGRGSPQGTSEAKRESNTTWR